MDGRRSWPYAAAHTAATAELPAVGSSIVLRTRGDPAPLEPAIRAAVLELGSRFEVRELRSFRDIREASILRERMLAHVSIVFAALGALLAAVGIAGVVTYSVTQRTSEIALRMALGARADDVVRQVVGRAMGLVAGGVGIGLLGVVAATPLISNWLFGVPSHDPISLGAVVLVVAASGFLGAYAPAKRATRRIDPIVLLKGG